MKTFFLTSSLNLSWPLVWQWCSPQGPSATVPPRCLLCDVPCVALWSSCFQCSSYTEDWALDFFHHLKWEVIFSYTKACIKGVSHLLRVCLHLFWGVFLLGLCTSEEPGPPLSVNVFILDQAQVSLVLHMAFCPEALQNSAGVVQRLTPETSIPLIQLQCGGQKGQKMCQILFDLLSAWLPFLLSLLSELWVSSHAPVLLAACPRWHKGREGHLNRGRLSGKGLTWSCAGPAEIWQRCTLRLGLHTSGVVTTEHLTETSGRQTLGCT